MCDQAGKGISLIKLISMRINSIFILQIHGVLLGYVLMVCGNGNDQYADTFVAMLESRGMKGSVQVNGKIIKRGNICVVNSGDEVVFGRLANHAYVSIYFISVRLFDQY